MGRLRPQGPRAMLIRALLTASTLTFTGAVQAQWVESPGEGWADLTVYHLDTTENFGFDGEI